MRLFIVGIFIGLYFALLVVSGLRWLHKDRESEPEVISGRVRVREVWANGAEVWN